MGWVQCFLPPLFSSPLSSHLSCLSPLTLTWEFYFLTPHLFLFLSLSHLTSCSFWVGAVAGSCTFCKLGVGVGQDQGDHASPPLISFSSSLLPTHHTTHHHTTSLPTTTTTPPCSLISLTTHPLLLTCLSYISIIKSFLSLHLAFIFMYISYIFLHVALPHVAWFVWLCGTLVRFGIVLYSPPLLLCFLCLFFSMPLLLSFYALYILFHACMCACIVHTYSLRSPMLPLSCMYNLQFLAVCAFSASPLSFCSRLCICEHLFSASSLLDIACMLRCSSCLFLASSYFRSLPLTSPLTCRFAIQAFAGVSSPPSLGLYTFPYLPFAL